MKKFLEGLALPVVLTYQGTKGAYRAGKWVHGKFQKRKPVYGDAAWATDKELGKGGHLGGRGFVFGRTKAGPLLCEPEACLVMQAKRGYGKSSTMGATLARASGEHLVVYDPPGGLLNRFEAELMSKGYQVVKIDLDEPMSGVAYDPFSFFTGSLSNPGSGSNRYTEERDASTLARLIVAEPKGHPHFTGVCEGVIAGTVLYLHLLQKPKAKIEELVKILTGLSKTDRNHYLSQVAASGNPFCTSGVNGYLDAKGDEQGSHDTTNNRKLRPWSMGVYADLTRKTANPWAWEDVWLSPQPMAVFVVGGVGEPENFAPFLRVVFGQCAASLSRMYNRHKKPIGRGVKLMIDEAALLGYCEPIVNVLTELRKVGVTAFLCYQSLTQLREAFGEKHKTILDNSDLIITGGGNNITDYEMVSKLIGKRTDWSMSKNKGGGSESETGIYVISPDELRRLEKGQHVALVGNLAVKCEAPWKIHNGAVVY